MLRALKAEDLDSVFDILSDPKTVSGRSFKKDTTEQAHNWLSKRNADETKLGYGMWAVEKNPDGVISLCGFFEHDAGVEVGYVVKFEFQGHGFGTEAASAAIIAAKNVGLNVFATTRPSNIASAKVAEENGLVRTGGRIATCPELDVYRLRGLLPWRAE
ncbi:MAG: GNAT family N-acetyltransferase [Pseudomonadota bacterium]